MAYCTLCQKSFKTEPALHQHIENSPAHSLVHCDLCNKDFSHAEALAQHIRDSPTHKDPYKCEPCQRTFKSEESLNQHLQTSSKHAAAYTCAPCARSFASEEALHQHLQTSSKHATSYTCNLCDRTFTSEEALQQHSRDSPAHASAPHPCARCTRAFASASALAQHARDSHGHAQPPRDTPLDAFFRAYEASAGFAYDRGQGPAASFGRLRGHMGWRHGSAEGTDAWERYQEALRRELEVWFGAEDDLANWHALCRAVGVAPLPGSTADCERALRGRHVNLVDLVEWARKGGVDGVAGTGGRVEPVEVFETVGELAEYCYETKKYFRLTLVENAGEAGDGNVVIRHLLRRLLSGGKGRRDSVVGYLGF